MVQDETLTAGREHELIEAGRRYELVQIVRETVRHEMRAGFRRHYGDATPEEIRDQHIRLRAWMARLDKWSDRFWYSFAMATGWLLIALAIGNWVVGNPLFEGFLKKMGSAE